MKISEEDIFMYVLYPNKLNQDINNYIRANENLFPVQIEFFKSYITSFNSPDIEIQSRKAIERILPLQNIIELFPLTAKIIPRKYAVTFAAATRDEVVKQSESITYSDENSKYLMRLISNKDKCILYFFPKSDNKDQELKITLMPSVEIHIIKNTSQQIEITQPNKIEKILIEEK